mmetsp:Transcript_5713/g.18405  ORF Transcript_5713/g.18405 Transcript_5713/m.18405 type:complete len:218 (+) Transcript_5713:1077-1730(+)
MQRPLRHHVLDARGVPQVRGPGRHVQLQRQRALRRGRQVDQRAMGVGQHLLQRQRPRRPGRGFGQVVRVRGGGGPRGERLRDLLHALPARALEDHALPRPPVGDVPRRQAHLGDALHGGGVQHRLAAVPRHLLPAQPRLHQLPRQVDQLPVRGHHGPHLPRPPERGVRQHLRRHVQLALHGRGLPRRPHALRHQLLHLPLGALAAAAAAAARRFKRG